MVPFGLCSFLWKHTGKEVDVYGATGKNDYYVLSQTLCIALGGGYGLTYVGMEDLGFGLTLSFSMDIRRYLQTNVEMRNF